MSKLRERFQAAVNTFRAEPNFAYSAEFGCYDDYEIDQMYDAYQAALWPVRELVEKWDYQIEEWKEIGAGGRAFEMFIACRNELAKLLEE